MDGTESSAQRIATLLQSIHYRIGELKQVSSGKATVKSVRMEYATSDTNAAFSFGIRSSIPLELKRVQQITGNDLALFLDIGYMGEADYSNPETFDSSPLVNILVSKTAFPGSQQADGCPSLCLLCWMKQPISGQC